MSTQGRGLAARLAAGRTVPILVILIALLVTWYAGALGVNRGRVLDNWQRQEFEGSFADYVEAAWTIERPPLPTPWAIAVEIRETTYGVAAARYRGLGRALERLFTNPRSLVFHAGVTLGATLLGFVLGTTLGIVLAVGIVYVRTLDRSMMPWVIASQTVPILAIAPMIIVTLGNLGLTGMGPKAVISAYLSFFPVAIGMVKGLRSADPLHEDLMRTYSATPRQIFFKLRVPASIAFLFPSLKVGIALSLVGAIVGELPTGAQAGIGARLLQGSYYGNMAALWAALIVSGLMALICIGLVGLAERLVRAARGGRL